MPISKLDTPRVPTLPRQSARELQPIESTVSVRAGHADVSSFDTGKLATQAGPRGDSWTVSVIGHEIQGKPSKQQELLTAGNAALKKGDYAAARKAFEELKSLPDEPVKLLGSDTSANADGTHDHPAVGKGVNSTRIDDGAFQLGSTKLANQGLAQAEQLERMSKLTKKTPFDPHSMKDVQAYFKEFAKGKDAAAVSKELGAYMKNFYAHAGEKGSVTWSEKIARKDRAANAELLLSNQPTDKAGRKIINCEGFAFLAAAALRDVKTADGKPRFDVHSYGGASLQPGTADNSGHEIAYVFDNTSKPKGACFVVNNDTVAMDAKAHDTPEKRAARIGRQWESVKYD